MQHPKLLHGVYGGLIGGLVFAGILVINGTFTSMGMLTLPLIGSLVGHASAWMGFGIHMLTSALIGAAYVLIFGRLEKGMVDGLHYGMFYGAAWWFVGQMTLMPLLLGLEIGSQWTTANAFRLLPSFIGHLVYGAILGMTVGAFRDASLPFEDEAVREARGREEPRGEVESEVTPRKRRPPLRHTFFRRRPAPGMEEPGDK